MLSKSELVTVIAAEALEVINEATAVNRQRGIFM